jgi:hypothetical protein
LGSRKTTPSAHEPLISWESVADVPLAGLSSTYRWCVRFTPIGSLLNGPRDFTTANQGR